MHDAIGGTEPQDITPTDVISVGEEFIQFAENYWSIEDRYSMANYNPNHENIDWEVVRPIFVSKINQIIKDRLKI